MKRNSEPVENVIIELRSTLQTDVTDKNGRPQFNSVECGKHSLTSIENGKIVGYTEFVLTEGEQEQTEFNLQDNDLYKVTVNKDKIGIDLTLNLEENGAISVESISYVKKPTDVKSPLTGGNSKSFAVLVSVKSALHI